MSMFDFILQSRIKYFMAVVVAICFIIVFLTNSFSDEDEVATIEAHMQLMEAQKRKHMEALRGMNGDRPREGFLLGAKGVAVENQGEEPKPPDFDVKFYSGKEMVKIVDGEKVPFQIHEVVIENLASEEIRLECKDSFTKFGEVVAPGGHYKFSVTDIFHKRHYWCVAHDANLGGVKYAFRAYGEGAPRDNNQIILRTDGAYINGKIVNIIEEKSTSKSVLINPN